MVDNTHLIYTGKNIIDNLINKFALLFINFFNNVTFDETDDVMLYKSEKFDAFSVK